mmetsp:Transcript_8104/g.19396  ORF Transcript_8104/g.19396 Transcript_8104/m.19396 type:complete len:582 (+) Transcript_8104:2126-3871(+)
MREGRGVEGEAAAWLHPNSLPPPLSSRGLGTGPGTRRRRPLPTSCRAPCGGRLGGPTPPPDRPAGLELDPGRRTPLAAPSASLPRSDCSRASSAADEMPESPATSLDPPFPTWGGRRERETPGAPSRGPCTAAPPRSACARGPTATLRSPHGRASVRADQLEADVARHGPLTSAGAGGLLRALWRRRGVGGPAAARRVEHPGLSLGVGLEAARHLLEGPALGLRKHSSKDGEEEQREEGEDPEAARATVRVAALGLEEEHQPEPRDGAVEGAPEHHPLGPQVGRHRLGRDEPRHGPEAGAERGHKEDEARHDSGRRPAQEPAGDDEVGDGAPGAGGEHEGAPAHEPIDEGRCGGDGGGLPGREPKVDGARGRRGEVSLLVEDDGGEDGDDGDTAGLLRGRDGEDDRDREARAGRGARESGPPRGRAGGFLPGERLGEVRHGQLHLLLVAAEAPHHPDGGIPVAPLHEPPRGLRQEEASERGDGDGDGCREPEHQPPRGVLILEHIAEDIADERAEEDADVDPELAQAHERPAMMGRRDLANEEGVHRQAHPNAEACDKPPSKQATISRRSCHEHRSQENKY